MERKKLKKKYDKRQRFVGVFERTGMKSGYKSMLPTMLLLDIRDYETNEILTDHLWFNLTKGFESVDLHKGDVVSFDARVKSYWKGYQSYDYYSQKEMDYHLERPTKIKKEAAVYNPVEENQEVVVTL